MTVNDNDKPISVMFDHCRSLYDKMKNTAKVVDVGDGTKALVWEGKLTQVFNELHMSSPYYTSIRQYLMAMGCMEQLRRGGGNADSSWRLLTEPTEEAWRAAKELSATKQPTTKTAMLEQQVRSLNTRVGNLEDLYKQLVARG